MRLRRRRPIVVQPRLAAGALGLALAAAVACLASGCGGSASDGTATTTSPTPAWSVVALGDSVPRGTNCDCTPYPPLTASDLATATGSTVTAANDSVGGYTTADVLKQLRDDDRVIEDVRGADAVEIEIGANDVGYSSTCGTSVECYGPMLPTVEKNLDAIVARVHELTSGRKVDVVLLDYWSVWLGGTYAEAKGEAYVDAAKTMTHEIDTIVKSTASRTGSFYVDLRAAFKGPDYAYDETHYLSDDGDHPNAAGHRQIATATEAVIQQAVGR